MFSSCIIFSTKPLFRLSFRPFTTFSILKFTRIHSLVSTPRKVITRGKINNLFIPALSIIPNRGFRNNRVCLVLNKEKEENIEGDDDTLKLENDELFPTTLLQKSLETNTLTIPPRVSQEFYNLYTKIIHKTRPETPLHEFPKHTRLNNLIYHIKTREDALLLPKVVAQWRKKLLPSTPMTTHFIIKKCCEVNAEDVVFHMLTDRTKYSLLPNREGFRRIMLAFANRIVDPSSVEKEISLDKQKILDNLYKTFGLMTYYDVSQYDVHLYTILILASLKIENEEGWKRVDITASEFLENLDKMNNEALELHPIPSNEEEENELKKHGDKFSEYDVKSRISRLVTCIDMVNILDKWYVESKKDTEKAESFRKLKESWNNEIENYQLKDDSLI